MKASRIIPAFDVQLFLDSAGVRRNVAKFRGKETIFSQGDPARNVMYIQEGGVKLTVVNTSGKEAVVAILGAGDFCGEACDDLRFCVPALGHTPLPNSEIIFNFVRSMGSRSGFLYQSKNSFYNTEYLCECRTIDFGGYQEYV
jgi:hypothetical protein